MAAPDDSYLEWRHLIEQLNRVLHDIGCWVVHSCSWGVTGLSWALIACITLLLTLFLVVLVVACVSSIHHSSCLLTFLKQEGLLIQDEIVEHTRKENALQHNQVADNFTCKEGILQFLVLNEIVKPLLTKSRHSAHLKEVWRLEPGHAMTSRTTESLLCGSWLRLGRLSYHCHITTYWNAHGLFVDYLLQKWVEKVRISTTKYEHLQMSALINYYVMKSQQTWAHDLKR